MKKNFAVVSRLLALAGVVLGWICVRTKEQPEKNILMYIGLSCFIGLTIVVMINFIKPGLFKDRPTHSD